MSLPVKINSQKTMLNGQTEFFWRTLLNTALMACPDTRGGTFGMFVKQKVPLASSVLHSENEE